MGYDVKWNYISRQKFVGLVEESAAVICYTILNISNPKLYQHFHFQRVAKSILRYK